MQITPETRNIAEIFPIEGLLKYKIPIYQRNYSWLDDQIEELVFDILNEPAGYYIGNVLITQKEDNETLEIVDGQQRLTTISLLLLAIFETSKRFMNASPTSIEEVSPLRYDIKRKLLVNKNIDTPRYTLLTKDNIIYKEIMRTVLIEDKNYNGKKLKFSLRYQRIKEILISNFDNFNSLRGFYEKLNEVEMLKITVTKLSDAYSIFTSLNSKGLPLTLVDLLKNEYLKQSMKEGINEVTAINSWDSFIEIFSGDREFEVKDVTQFLANNFDALESTDRKSITKGSALDEYIKLIDRHGSNYIETLKDRSHWFDFIKDSEGNVEVEDEIKKLVLKLSLLDSTQCYPLLLFLFVKQRDLMLEKQHFAGIINTIINFFIRSNITKIPKSSNIRSIFINLNRDVQKDKLRGSLVFTKIKEKLLSESASDEVLESILTSIDIYEESPKLTRFLLIDIERRIEEEKRLLQQQAYFTKATADTLDDYLPTVTGKQPKLRWTIEHILPEGDILPTYWKSMISPNEPDKASTLQEEYVHRIGNLTLTPYNSELGQKSFNDKKNKQDSQNYVGLRLPLAINESIFDGTSQEVIDAKKTWTTEDIIRRTKYFAKQIIRLYKL